MVQIGNPNFGSLRNPQPNVGKGCQFHWKFRLPSPIGLTTDSMIDQILTQFEESALSSCLIVVVKPIAPNFEHVGNFTDLIEIS